jgi:PAS domain S-box-containing protein
MIDGDPLPLRYLLDSAPDGFIVVNSHGAIVWANSTAGRLFGFRDGELLGRPVEDLVPARFRERHVHDRHAYQAAPRGRPMGLGLHLLGLKQDGSEFPVEISLSPVSTSDGTLITAIVRDVTERRLLEDERNLLAIELETERERDRIAMDLHDGIMQDIYAVALALELGIDDAEGARLADAAIVERSIDQLHEVVRNIRSYIFDLRPREFSGRLQDALFSLAQEFQQNSQVRTHSEINQDLEVEPGAALALYHIAHEGLSNIQRHAKAGAVEIRLARDDGAGLLEIADDGVGFDTTAAVSEGHRGLRNISARAGSIGAQLNIESAPGRGTRYSVRFPLRP